MIDKLTGSKNIPSKGNILVRLLQHVREAISNFISPVRYDPVVLPESVRYAIAHNNSRIQKRDILALLQPQYWFVGVWLVLKYYEKDILKWQTNNTDDFFWLLQKIVELLDADTHLEDIMNYMRERLKNNTEKTLETTGKIWYIARIGFVEFCSGVADLYRERKWYDTVILLANSGLMGLPWIIEQIKQEKGEIIVCFPKFRMKDLFYVLFYHEKDNSVSLKRLDREEMLWKFEDKKILILDDISNTGKTEDQITQILEPFWPKSTQLKTYIQFPDRRLPVTDKSMLV